MQNRPILGLTIGKEVIFVEINNILYCKSEGNNCVLNFIDGEPLVSPKNLKDFENIFTENQFHRVHNSFVVNLKHVVKLIHGQEDLLVLSDGSEVPISRRRKNKFLNLFLRL